MKLRFDLINDSDDVFSRFSRGLYICNFFKMNICLSVCLFCSVSVLYVFCSVLLCFVLCLYVFSMCRMSE